MAGSCSELEYCQTTDGSLQNSIITSDGDEEFHIDSKCLKEDSKIQAIDKASVHRICSGQVVLTLATAVKELVENSIDAGASSVEIKLKDYGSDSIEVTDNGSGVDEKDFEGLTLKHYTSKLQDFDDLVNVTSFGFRGEALSSLCALSNMVITTRHKSAAVGTRLEFDLNGKILTRKSAPRQVGTTVQIQNIFYSLPVRHKEFQRNLKKEFVKLVHVLNAYCLISTSVRISCTNQTGKGSRSIVVSTNGNDSVRDNIANVFSPKQLQSLLKFPQVQAKDDICQEFGVKSGQKSAVSFRIEGFVSKCEHGQGRSSADRQFIFINQRPCDHAKILKLINEVYHSYNRHQNPFIALSILVDKESVDVNVTPDKRQIFLEGENLLLATLKSSLIELFEPTTAIYKVNNPMLASPSVPRSHIRLAEYTLIPQEFSESQDSDSPSLSSSLSKLKRSFSSAFARRDSKDSSDHINSLDMKSTPHRKSNSLSATSGHGSITQFFSKYSPVKSKLSSFPSLDKQAVTESQSCDIKKSEVNDSMDIFGHQDQIMQHPQCLSCENDIADPCRNISSPCLENYMINSSDKEYLHTSTTGASPNFLTDKLNQDSYFEDKDINHESGATELAVHSDNVPEICTENKVSVSDQQILSSMETVVKYDSNQTDGWTDKDSSHKMDDNQTFLTSFDSENHCKVTRKEQNIMFSLSSLKKLVDSNANSSGSGLQYCRSFRAKISPADNKSAEDELQKEISKDMFDKMEILGQFNLGFIVTKLGHDLFIVDQHATDEKYNFEMLQRDTVLQNQKLIIPQSLDLTASNETILIDNLEIFKKNGFDFLIDPNAPPTQRVKLVSAPLSKNWTFGKDDIEELLFMLSDSPNVMCWPSRVRMMFATRACRKSIMIGTALNKYQMSKLVSHMGQIEQPWNCPHGRPTMRHLFNLDMLPSSCIQ